MSRMKLRSHKSSSECSAKVGLSQTNGISFNDLSHDDIAEVLKYLPPLDLIRSERVDKRFKENANASLHRQKSLALVRPDLHFDVCCGMEGHQIINTSFFPAKAIEHIHKVIKRLPNLRIFVLSANFPVRLMVRHVILISEALGSCLKLEHVESIIFERRLKNANLLKFVKPGAITCLSCICAGEVAVTEQFIEQCVQIKFFRTEYFRTTEKLIKIALKHNSFCALSTGIHNISLRELICLLSERPETKMKVLDLDTKFTTSITVENVKMIVEKLPNLEHLTVWGTVDVLIPLQGLPHLKTLSWYSRQVSFHKPAQSSSVLNSLKAIKKLERLRIEGEMVGIAVFVSLAKCLPNLTHLDVSRCNVSSRGYDHGDCLIDAFTALPKLRDLKMRGTWTSPFGIYKFLLSAPKIRHLEVFTSVPCTGKHLQEVGAMYKNRYPNRRVEIDYIRIP